MVWPTLPILLGVTFMVIVGLDPLVGFGLMLLMYGARRIK